MALDPRNYQYISLAAYFEWFNATIQPKFKNFSVRFDVLPDATRESIQGAMTRLEDLSQDADKKTAVGALENLSMLNAMFGDSSAVSVAYLRRAVSIEPTHDQSWDMLIGSLLKSASPEEITALCESRLKFKDSARNHLLLSKALERQEKWGAAGAEAEAALKREPDNLTANLVAHLILAALALKQSADPDYLSKASEQFISVEELFNKIPQSSESVSCSREFNLNLAIYNDLLNTPDSQKAAKACIEAVLNEYPNDEQANAILHALN